LGLVRIISRVLWNITSSHTKEFNEILELYGVSETAQSFSNPNLGNAGFS